MKLNKMDVDIILTLLRGELNTYSGYPDSPVCDVLKKNVIGIIDKFNRSDIFYSKDEIVNALANSTEHGQVNIRGFWMYLNE